LPEKRQRDVPLDPKFRNNRINVWLQHVGLMIETMFGSFFEIIVSSEPIEHVTVRMYSIPRGNFIISEEYKAGWSAFS